VLLAGAAIGSALITLTSALVPLILQPDNREEYYDRVYGVDPAIATLPESNGLLLHTAHTFLSHTAYYPLLGRSLERTVVLVDADEATTDLIVTTMQTVRVHYAYVASVADALDAVDAVYPEELFALEHVSSAREAGLEVERRLYRLK
jgi:hypothetical protein